MNFDSYPIARIDLDVPINIYANSYGTDKQKSQEPFIWVEDKGNYFKVNISKTPEILIDSDYKNTLKNFITENYDILIAHWENKINDRIMLNLVETPIMFKAILNEHRNAITENNSDNGICYDGVVDEKEYFSQKQRLMFLLKETNGNKSNGDKNDILTDWNYMKWVNEQAYQIKGLYRTCYRNIAMWSKMFDVFTKENRTPDIDEFINEQGLIINKELCRSLLNIGIVNLKKSWGTQATDQNILNEYLNKDIAKNDKTRGQISERKQILEYQIKELKPSIILCGGTFDFAKMLFGNDNIKPISAENQCVEFFEALDTKFVKCWHPSKRMSYTNSFNHMLNIFKNIL